MPDLKDGESAEVKGSAAHALYSAETHPFSGVPIKINSARQDRFGGPARFRKTLGYFPGSFESAVRPWNGTCPLLTSAAREFLFG